jgi:hypothetical protein
MPKVVIDYSNTIIYKIFCKDPEIKDIYIGHTTNFVQRKHAHKQNCNNIKSPCYNLKLYKTIRENGNWSNWDMLIVQFYNCKDHLEARQKEQDHYIALNATLNSIEPLSCKQKNISFNEADNENTIVDTNVIATNISATNISNEFSCKICNFKCLKKGDWNRHNLSLKHIKNEQNNIIIHKNKTEHICVCGKQYSYRQGLSVHKKTCIILKKSSEKGENDLIKTLIKDNTELKAMILDAFKLIQSNNNSINNL